MKKEEKKEENTYFFSQLTHNLLALFDIQPSNCKTNAKHSAS